MNCNEADIKCRLNYFIDVDGEAGSGLLGHHKRNRKITINEVPMKKILSVPLSISNRS